ncbi:related to CHL1 - protein of the DEAH box family [Ustilago trichophora]|uniref:ATP-dependent DNA helicase CHL1 n=1 Tax=Ustilago trichophora TaxID=86804 RepID=A0A5C3E811_9BASI|nr:related to CHL1 - protein of the DEAH box family [Ustilago trichophora]
MSDQHEALKLPIPGSSITDAELASREFEFPYPQAYSIQLDLMRQVFATIEDGKVGLFESPTGTGKSLSLICAAFTWLRQNAQRHSRGGSNGQGGIATQQEPDWVVQHEQDRKRKQQEMYELDLKDRIAAARAKQAALKRNHREGLLDADTRAAKKHRSTANETHDPDSDDDLLIDESEGAKHAQALRMATYTKLALAEPSTQPNSTNLSPAVLALMQQYEQTHNPSTGHDDGEEPETLPRIIYASRTHSQLSQFVAELKKTSFGQVDVLDVDKLPVRTIGLGSRRQMCINEDVQRLGKNRGAEAMNERCLELMKGKGKSKCPSLPTFDQAGRAQILEFRDAAMAQVGDIEDLVQLGKSTKTCPYFAARSSAKQAELVTLPYNLLLQKDARTALGISLEGCVILIDEAHNLIDTILSTHSVTIDSRQIAQASKQIDTYLDKFALRLKGSNEQNLRKVRKVLSSLSAFFAKHVAAAKGKGKGKAENEVVMTAADLVRGMSGNLDQVNLVTLETWLKETQIARKISGYAEKQSKRVAEQTDSAAAAAAKRNAGQNGGKGRHSIKVNTSKPSSIDQTPSTNQSAISSMHAIESFILSLANRSEDGRVVLTTISDPIHTHESIIRAKYQLLNPSHVFKSLVDEARSVILAGGTMEPISDFRQQLLPFLPPERLTTFSCGHVIPPTNLLVSVLSTSPKGLPFEFKFDSRDNIELLDELGRTLVNLCNIVPKGLVVFVPSYAFLDRVMARWKDTASGGMLQRLGAKKKIFVEPKTTMEVDRVLGEYTGAIRGVEGKAAAGGAIMFAVVGAKLSEGINFSDDLARGVVMVGMPFANMHSPELAERMKYVRDLAKQDPALVGSTHKVADPGHELYTNLCMKAVNQSIGRAVRHQNDYAALILLDRRYARPEIRQRLPGWIRNQVTVADRFGSMVQQTAAFFKHRKD